MTTIADTGALYSLIDASDQWHERVRDWWIHNTQPIVVPISVVPELSYLLGKRISAGAESALIRAIADGEFVVEDMAYDDWPTIATMVENYADLPLGFTDASVAVMAERLGTWHILTTDRGHFGIVRSAKGRRFQVVP